MNRVALSPNSSVFSACSACSTSSFPTFSLFLPSQRVLLLCLSSPHWLTERNFSSCSKRSAKSTKSTSDLRNLPVFKVPSSELHATLKDPPCSPLEVCNFHNERTNLSTSRLILYRLAGCSPALSLSSLSSSLSSSPADSLSNALM